MQKKETQIFLIIIFIFNAYKFNLPITFVFASLVLIFLSKILINKLEYQDKYIYILGTFLIPLLLYNIISRDILYINIALIISIISLELLKKRAEWLNV